MPATFDLLLYRGRQSTTQHSHLFLEHTYEMRLDYTRKRGACILFTPSCDLSHSSFVTYTEKNKGTHSSMTRSHNCVSGSNWSVWREGNFTVLYVLKYLWLLPFVSAIARNCVIVWRGGWLGKKNEEGCKKLQGCCPSQLSTSFSSSQTAHNLLQSAPPTFVQQSPYSTLCFDAMSISAAENKQQTESAQLQEKMEKGTEDQAWNSAV